MTETAVALFEHPGAAESVIDALRDNGIPSEAIRLVAEPKVAVPLASGSGLSEHTASLSNELKRMGATEGEAAAYANGVKQGNVMVLVNGTPDQARTAIEVMNDFFAMEIDEFDSTDAKVGPGAVNGRIGDNLSFPDRPVVNAVDNTAESTASTDDPNVTAKIEHHRNRTEGAKVFSW